MSFNLANLSALSYSNGFTLWHYKTEDFLIGNNHDNYWGPAHKMLRPGDFIFCNCGKPTSGEAHYILVVLSVCSEHKIVNVAATCGLRTISLEETSKEAELPN